MHEHPAAPPGLPLDALLADALLADALRTSGARAVRVLDGRRGAVLAAAGAARARPTWPGWSGWRARRRHPATGSRTWW